MDTVVVTLADNSRVFLLDHVLEPAVLAQAHSIAATFDPDNPDWTLGLTAYPRWLYNTQLPAFDPIRRAFDSGPMLDSWREQLTSDRVGYFMLTEITFFRDAPGTPPLRPHKELAGAWLAQVYIAQSDHAYNGTTIYTDANQVLFQLPYRDNSGWLFDTGRTVLHGREHAVPEGLERFSLMIWYDLVCV
jgi:hypothetical protein